MFGNSEEEMIKINLKMYLILAAYSFFPILAKAEQLPDLCVAKICLGVEQVNEKSLVKNYGEGKRQLGMGNDPSVVRRCFYDKTQNLWLEFTFDKHSIVAELSDIFVSSQSLCEKTFVPKKSFPKIVLKNGLVIGSLDRDVIKVKGKPNRVDENEKSNSSKLLEKTYFSSIYGETVLVYDYSERDENEMNYFYISNGKIKTIWLSISE